MTLVKLYPETDIPTWIRLPDQTQLGVLYIHIVNRVFNTRVCESVYFILNDIKYSPDTIVTPITQHGLKLWS